tara:strand:- start:11978 stop:12328 length:351 start_codon:yes stop_codon:yes gene_type:complete
MLPMLLSSCDGGLSGNGLSDVSVEEVFQSEAEISGTYTHISGPNVRNYQSVTFTQNGSGILSPSGDMVSVVVDGDQIIIGSGYGGAKGAISGDRLEFPNTPGVVVGEAFAGTWVQE